MFHRLDRRGSSRLRRLRFHYRLGCILWRLSRRQRRAFARPQQNRRTQGRDNAQSFHKTDGFEHTVNILQKLTLQSSLLGFYPAQRAVQERKAFRIAMPEAVLQKCVVQLR